MVPDWDEIFYHYHDHHHDHKHQQMPAMIQNKYMRRAKRRSQNPNQHKLFATVIIGIDFHIVLIRAKKGVKIIAYRRHRVDHKQ